MKGGSMNPVMKIAIKSIMITAFKARGKAGLSDTLDALVRLDEYPGAELYAIYKSVLFDY